MSNRDTNPQIVYIVQHLDWQYQDFLYGIEDEEPVRAFSDRRDAEEYRRQRDAEERTTWPEEKLARRSGDTEAFFEILAVELV